MGATAFLATGLSRLMIFVFVTSAVGGLGFYKGYQFGHQRAADNFTRKTMEVFLKSEILKKKAQAVLLKYQTAVANEKLTSEQIIDARFKAVMDLIAANPALDECTVPADVREGLTSLQEVPE